MRQRRPKLVVAISTGLVLAIVAALQVLHSLDARRRAIETADQRARNMAAIVAAYVQDTFEVADASLRQLAVHSRRVGGPRASREDWDPILAAAKAAVAVGGSISVVDANGRIIHTTQPAIAGQSRRDTFIFERLSRVGDDELVVDRPFRTAVPPYQYIVPIGRRLTNARDEFTGMVVATILPDSFRQFLKTLDVGRHGVIWVFHPDGVVLFREPSSANPINRPAADNPVFRAALATNAAGAVTGPVEPGGDEYFSAFTRAQNAPVIVAVSFSRADVLANWTHQVRSAVFAVGTLAVVLAALVFVLFRQMDARARMEHALVDVQRSEAQRLRDANERLERALEGEQRARRETEQASYLKDEFLMTVSHELRTPLTAIYGWARVLATGTLAAEQHQRAVAAVERNARAQAKLIDDLLDVSRAISGKLRLDARPIVVADVLRAAVETLSPAMEARQIAFHSRIDPGLGTAMADPDRLQQIAWNLLSNAIKFTPEGGRIQFEATRAAQQMEIVVRDTGAGIAPEFLPYVFDRFRQQEAGTRRRFGGLGLGLAIVRHLVELHGGTARADSAGEGQGATFRVTLPLRAIVSGAAARSSAPPEAAATDDALKGLRILVVDDERDARELFSSILVAAGAQVVAAASADEAIDVAARQPIDVLVSDIEMPDTDGYELLQRLRANGAAVHLPAVAIAVTAHARAADRERALDAGFQGHIAKPVEPSELVAVIAALLRSRV